jgi:hypothetical protein
MCRTSLDLQRFENSFKNSFCPSFPPLAFCTSQMGFLCHQRHMVLALSPLVDPDLGDAYIHAYDNGSDKALPPLVDRDLGGAYNHACDNGSDTTRLHR